MECGKGPGTCKRAPWHLRELWYLRGVAVTVGSLLSPVMWQAGGTQLNGGIWAIVCHAPTWRGLDKAAASQVKAGSFYSDSLKPEMLPHLKQFDCHHDAT